MPHHKQLHRVTIAALSLFLGGCFTVLQRTGEAWSGDSSGRTTAATLDIVTAPVQAPVLVVAAATYGVGKAEHNAAKRKKDLWSEALRTDPRIALKERWDLKGNMQRGVFRESFSDPEVEYTLEMLEEIYDRCPEMRDYLFVSPACTAEFLEKHFEEASERASQISRTRLESIISNPNMPSRLIEQVALSESTRHVAHIARRQLRQRAQAEYEKERIYIPKDVDDCIRELDRMLAWDPLIERIQEGHIQSSGVHFGLGRRLRERWNLKEGSPLTAYFNGTGIYDPESMSRIVLESYFRHLRGEPIGLREQIDHHKNLR